MKLLNTPFTIIKNTNEKKKRKKKEKSPTERLHDDIRKAQK